MPITNKLYQVISAHAVLVEDSGNAANYPHGSTFHANSANKSIARLLRMNLIREVSSRENPSSAK